LIFENSYWILSNVINSQKDFKGYCIPKYSKKKKNETVNEPNLPKRKRKIGKAEKKLA